MFQMLTQQSKTSNNFIINITHLQKRKRPIQSRGRKSIHIVLLVVVADGSNDDNYVDDGKRTKYFVN